MQYVKSADRGSAPTARQSLLSKSDRWVSSWTIFNKAKLQNMVKLHIFPPLRDALADPKR